MYILILQNFNQTELQISLDKSNKKDTILSNYESFLLINEEAEDLQTKQDNNPLQILFDNEILGMKEN